LSRKSTVTEFTYLPTNKISPTFASLENNFVRIDIDTVKPA